jgi:hypothetical protein
VSLVDFNHVHAAIITALLPPLPSLGLILLLTTSASPLGNFTSNKTMLLSIFRYFVEIISRFFHLTDEEVSLLCHY